MDTSRRGWLIAALLALLLAGCAAPPAMVERFIEREPGELLARAEQQAPDEAARSRLEAADILARRGDATQALDVASRLDDRRLPPESRVRWALLLSSLGIQLDDPNGVLQAALALDEDLPFDREQRLTLRQRQGQALADLGEHAAAAEALLEVQAETDDAGLNDTLWSLLVRLDEPTLASLGDDPLRRGWRELVAVQRGSGGDIERLFERLDAWRGRHGGHPAARSLPGDLIALRDLRGREVSHLAVLLPESGPLANLAREIRRGLEVRQREAEQQGIRVPRLSFLDSSRGDLDALYAAATMAGAQAVIGPLDKDRVTRLEGRDSVPLPTLALNYGNNAENRAANLFQYGLSAEDEARQVARRAHGDGHRRAAMLFPGNEWGQRVARAFEREWQALGGELAQRVGYNPNAPATDAARRAAAGRPDMLFLLAIPGYARQVPPNLEFIGVDDLPIYGTSQLYEGRPQPRLDHDLNGVLFVEIPWLIPDAAVGGEAVLPFRDSYQRLRESDDPGLLKLGAMGVDAFELGRRLPQLQVLGSTEIQGATGTLRPAADGRIQRELPWARFEGGVPQLPLLNRFDDGRTR
ncbi:penicillin-binding protein activator [Halomonas pacifica]|uniref:penicillin-binding protein activator n=1 Tax=Bisbaumannia pacifica TaxID=77098 RepID=UPI0023597FAA|nr:penicillin-binding protein activator [Halomonas pacifica]MDC8803344.1 penicillin-binding protein activator [Halomonas pacifica]